MAITQFHAFLGWCSLINFGILLYWFAAIALFKPWVYRLHSRWFTISEQRFDEIHYQAMAWYKLSVVVLNFVPWLALHIIL